MLALCRLLASYPPACLAPNTFGSPKKPTKATRASEREGLNGELWEPSQAGGWLISRTINLSHAAHGASKSGNNGLSESDGIPRRLNSIFHFEKSTPLERGAQSRGP
jgi:hypothetical protein